MEKVEGENGVAEECAGRKYYPVIEEVRVLKSRLNNAVYLEIKGLSRSFGNGREREFCTCYMAETPLQMKKLIGKHIGAGSGITCGKGAQWSVFAYNQFSYNGKRQMSKQIIEGTAEHVIIPDGGTGLDVGCGSGALTIACAKRNPNAKMQGIDRWGKEYASFSKQLCENNSEAEGVDNTSFAQGETLKTRHLMP